jgi:hypothetical protein
VCSFSQLYVFHPHKWKKNPNSTFLTAILHRGLRNDFFSCHISFFHISFGLLFPFSFWTFISLFFLDFYFLFYYFSIIFYYFSTNFYSFSIRFYSFSNRFYSFSILSRSLILDSSKFFKYINGNNTPIYFNFTLIREFSVCMTHSM